MQGVAGVLIELTQEVQELEESITNKVHQLIAGMTAVEHVQGAEEHLERLEESVEGIRGLVEGVRMKMSEFGGSRELVLVTQKTVLCQQHQQEHQQQQQVLQWPSEDQQQEQSQHQQQQPQQQPLKQLECRSCHVQISRGRHGSSLISAKRRMREMNAQLQQQVVKVQRIEKGLQSLATFHSTQLLKGVTTLDLSALPSPSYHTLLFHLLSLSLHHSASLSTVFTVKAFPAMTTPCLQQTIVLNLPFLRKLDLSNCTRLVDSDLPQIARLTQLTYLCLAGCSGFRFSAAAPLSVASSTPNLADLSNLASLTNLAKLTNMTNLANLTNLTNLRRLNLSRTAVGDEGMAVWCQLTGITALDLRHCTRITCRSMHHIRQLQHLHTLNLAWVADSAADSAPGERWIRALGPMEELAWLSLFGWLLRDEGAIGVARFFPKLRALRCSAVAGAGLCSGAGGGLTRGGVKKMVKKLPCLRELWLLGGSEEVRKAVRKDRPWLTVLC